MNQTTLSLAVFFAVLLVFALGTTAAAPPPAPSNDAVPAWACKTDKKYSKSESYTFKSSSEAQACSDAYDAAAKKAWNDIASTCRSNCGSSGLKTKSYDKKSCKTKEKSNGKYKVKAKVKAYAYCAG